MLDHHHQISARVMKRGREVDHDFVMPGRKIHRAAKHQAERVGADPAAGEVRQIGLTHPDVDELRRDIDNKVVV